MTVSSDTQYIYMRNMSVPIEANGIMTVTPKPSGGKAVRLVYLSI
jgi:hypothetical protein